MATATGGDRLARAMGRMAERLRSASSVEVGFIDRSTYPDGTPVATVAAVQEFGGTVEVPGRDQTVYRRVGADGELKGGGKFVRASRSNFATTHAVPAHTVTVPPRPFFRNMIRANSGSWAKTLADALVASGYDARKALGALGQTVQEQLVDSIESNTPPPNAPSTAAAKGFDRTLVDTGVMKDSVTHSVK